MRCDVSGTNGPVGAGPRIQPGERQAGEAQPGRDAAERAEGHEQPRHAADEDAGTEVESTQPPVQGGTYGAQSRRELEGADGERYRGGEDVSVGTRAMRFEGRPHVGMEDRAQRQQRIDADGVAGDC